MLFSKHLGYCKSKNFPGVCPWTQWGTRRISSLSSFANFQAQIQNVDTFLAVPHEHISKQFFYLLEKVHFRPISAPLNIKNPQNSPLTGSFARRFPHGGRSSEDNFGFLGSSGVHLQAVLFIFFDFFLSVEDSKSPKL